MGHNLKVANALQKTSGYYPKGFKAAEEFGQYINNCL
jgi:hypothetical protein